MLKRSNTGSGSYCLEQHPMPRHSHLHPMSVVLSPDPTQTHLPGWRRRHQKSATCIDSSHLPSSGDTSPATPAWGVKLYTHPINPGLFILYFPGHSQGRRGRTVGVVDDVRPAGFAATIIIGANEGAVTGVSDRLEVIQRRDPVYHGRNDSPRCEEGLAGGEGRAGRRGQPLDVIGVLRRSEGEEQENQAEGIRRGR